MPDKAENPGKLHRKLSRTFSSLSIALAFSGCYDDLLVHVAELAPDTRGVEFKLSSGGQSCTSRVQPIDAGQDNFRVPLRCAAADLGSASELQLEVRALNERACAVGSGKTGVTLRRLGILPDETTVVPSPLVPSQCELSVTVQGAGHVISDPPGIDCPGPACSAYFDSTKTATLKSDPRYQVRWQQSGQGRTGELQLSMDQRRSISALFSPGPCGGDDFCLFNPVAQGNTLRAMASVPGQGTWIVGENGTILFYDPRGIAAVESGTAEDLYGVAASADGRVVWAVGRNGTIRSFDGSTWVAVAPPSSTNALLRGVWVSSDGLDAWIVGDSSTALHYHGSSPDAMQRGKADLRTQITVSSPVNLYAVWGSADQGIYISGEGSGGIMTVLHYELDGTVAPKPGLPGGTNSLFGMWGQGIELFSVGQASQILRREGDNLKGDPKDTSKPIPSKDLYAVWGTSASDLWAGGQSGTLLHRDSGKWWLQTSPWTQDIQTGALVNAGDGISGSMLIGGTGGALRLYQPQTQQWTPVGVSNTLHDVWGSSSDDIWAVGNAMILHQKQGVITALPQASQLRLNGIWGSSATDIWAVGDSGAILRSTDGKTWMPQSSAPSDLYSICGNGPSDVWAVGARGTVVRYNGTSSWTTQSGIGIPSSINLNGVWCGSDREVWIAGDSGSLYLFDGSNFGPITDLPKTDQHLLSIWGDGLGDLYVVGQAGTLLTRRADTMKWTLRTKPGVDLVRVSGRQGSPMAWAIGAGGTMLRMDAEDQSPVSGRTESLQGIFFPSVPVGSNSAWIVGNYGLLLQYAPPANR